jgi:hypothetical protein
MPSNRRAFHEKPTREKAEMEYSRQPSGKTVINYSEVTYQFVAAI